MLVLKSRDVMWPQKGKMPTIRYGSDSHRAIMEHN